MTLRDFGISSLCFLLVSCGSTETLRISGESEETFHASLAEMERSLSREERIHFHAAILRIRLTGIGSVEEARRSTGGKPIRAIEIKDQIDGLTIAEILELAERSDVEVGVLN